MKNVNIRSGFIQGFTVYFDFLQDIVEENDGDVHLNFDQMKDLKFMEAFVKESLRCWGIAFVERTCTKDYHIPELNITIPEGALVQIPGSGIMQEEHFFKVLSPA